MLKQILNLEGAQELSKKEQKTIQGGRWRCGYHFPGEGFIECPDGYSCYFYQENKGYCIPSIEPL